MADDWWQTLTDADLVDAGWVSTDETDQWWTHPEFPDCTFNGKGARRTEALKAGELSSKQKQISEAYENISSRLDEISAWLGKVEDGLTEFRHSFNEATQGNTNPKVAALQSMLDALESELTGQPVGEHDGWPLGGF